MKRFLASIMILILLMLNAGCSSVLSSKGKAAGEPTGSAGAVKVDGSGTDKLAAGEVKYFPTLDDKYKTARNDIFDFWFDIPNNWKAVDKSGNGEEFTIDSGNDKVSLLVYGATIDGKVDDFYRKLSGTDGNIEDFTFRDSWMGKKITNGTKLYYIRTDGDTYIIFYTDCKEDSGWFTGNSDTLEYIGQSLRIRQESFGSMGSEDSIALDDLQLGDIKLDMTYEKVLLTMKTKPENEKVDEYEGMESKTLFYKDGTEIYMVDGTIYSVNVISGDYPTPRGLKVGDTTEKLKELYGEPNNVNDETHWGYTYDGYELFSVVLKDNKIVEIQIDLVM
jgi:uncharacterized protein YceK